MPPPPQHLKLPHLDPPPQTDPPGAPPPPSPLLDPPLQCPPPRGLRPTVSLGGSWRPEPRGRPPRDGALIHAFCMALSHLGIWTNPFLVGDMNWPPVGDMDQALLLCSFVSLVVSLIHFRAIGDWNVAHFSTH